MSKITMLCDVVATRYLLVTSDERLALGIETRVIGVGPVLAMVDGRMTQTRLREGV